MPSVLLMINVWCEYKRYYNSERGNLNRILVSICFKREILFRWHCSLLVFVIRCIECYLFHSPFITEGTFNILFMHTVISVFVGVYSLKDLYCDCKFKIRMHACVKRNVCYSCYTIVITSCTN